MQKTSKISTNCIQSNQSLVQTNRCDIWSEYGLDQSILQMYSSKFQKMLSL